jgi:tyrosyl-tRNA synthetase
VLRRLAGPEPLELYAGYDPTAPAIHIGNSVSLLLLKALARDLGHRVTVLFGDFTARIGDPTDKDAVRRVLSAEEVEEHVASWDHQVAALFGDVPFTIRRNSEWFDTLSFADVIKLSAKTTVQQMLARDMFQERLKHDRPIYLNEFLYPVAQGYDSVALRVDGEVGGSDQIFNMLVGREFSRELIGKDKLVLATPLIVNTKTGKKMSKSEGELIALTDAPEEIRRKVLALDDSVTESVFLLCTERPEDWIAGHAAAHPREFKEELARELVRMYHGESAVDAAANAQEITHTGPLQQVLRESGLAASASDAKRLIEQGGVEVNGEVVTDWHTAIVAGDRIRVGKGKFAVVR